jgi:hypothetical protein
MADIFETYESGDVASPENGFDGQHARQYRVMGEPSSVAATAGVRAVSPLAVQVGNDILVRQSVDAKPFPIDNWNVNVVYGAEDQKASQERPEPGVWKFSFRVGGRTQVFKFLPMMSRHWNSKGIEAPETWAVEMDDKGIPKGVALPVGGGTFSITCYYDPRVVTPGFFRRANRAVGSINSDVFLGEFQPGEIKYLGCGGEGDLPTVAGQRVQPIPLTHDFDFENNSDNVIVKDIDQHRDAAGNPVASIVKRGWDYVHTRELRQQDDNTKAIAAQVKHVYVSATGNTIDMTNFFGFGNQPG